ncbi:ATP-binding protein [Cetobacterium sp. SF1]|uniref:ATP-binding protein n=1 Tax=Cetobacterium sp. SF1 TaxID=3417654 RepID=UPI003CF4E207
MIYLICDEWSYILLETKGAELLFQVIADCYERKSLIIKKIINLIFKNFRNKFFTKIIIYK